MRTMLIVAMLLASQVALAETNPMVPAASTADVRAVRLVEHGLVQPLAKKEQSRSRFSRARLPPSQRRVRALDSRPRRDAHGDAFVRFAIDERHGISASAKWQQDTITGCVYLAGGKVFVKKGDEFRPAEFLLGKYRKAAGSAICHDDPTLARTGG